MKILIDADGCPVVDLTVRLAAKHGAECVILCDTAHEFNREGAQTVIVEKGADSVDFKLVNLVREGDIVVTQDYGLAAMCLARKAVPLSQNGMVYTDKNIDQLLFTRYVSKKIRNSGGRLKGPSKRKPEQDKAFEEALERLIKDISK
ncbi:MAG: YaiI/YqxD family protein [Acutalibacteraceae bacterium]|nr:YaiI/YqxD family protein [Clostridiaceae bacterium]MDD6703878.1 YaiI/YqxD family protein [Clostridiaceae bacterium]MEE1247172.1 YaiI/YqxD family protein [Acutalibacteraceae bacterium]